MDLLLGAVWAVAQDLGITPAVVLEWRESELALWTVVADKHHRQRMLLEMVALSHAVWDPKELPKLLGERRPPMGKEEAQKAIQRAEQISKMRMRPVGPGEARRRK